MAKVKHDLTQTRKTFRLIGKVVGVTSKNYYQETTTKSGRSMRIINFGIETSTTNKIFVQLLGTENDKVYFSKKNEETGKWDTEEVAWSDRVKFDKDGYRLTGAVNVGLQRALDASGRESNVNQHLTPFDACKAIKNNLTDGARVFVKGTKDVSTYLDKENNTRVSVKLTIDQISLCSDQDSETPEEADIDYSDIANIPNVFEDTVIYESIKQDSDSTADNFSATVTTIHVGYDNICEIDYKVRNPKLAKIMKERMKPYNAIKISGIIVNNAIVKEEDDDGWGISDSSKKVTDYQKEYTIMRCEGSSLDTTSYSKENIEKAKASLLEFNSNDKADGVPAPVIKSSDVAEEDDLW